MRFTPFAFFSGLAFAAVLPSIPSIAAAQTPSPSIDARTWRPSTDPGGGLVLEPTTTPAAGAWNVGAFFNYSYRPVRLGPLNAIDSLAALDLVANVGLGARLSFGLDLPMALYQTGSQSTTYAVTSSGELPKTALGDLGLNAKATLISNAQGGFGLAGLVNVTVPTGDQTSFMGEGSMTVGARLVAEYTLLVASIQGSLGYTVRTQDRLYGAEYGDSIPWSVAIAIKPDLFKLDSGHRQRWEIGAHGWVPAGPVAPFGGTDAATLSPALLSLGDRIEIGHYRDTSLLVGAEIGLNDAVGTPIVRGIVGINWAPRNHDIDGDGVPDDVDQCPELPEDKDGFEDNDGCPEIDNDDDGVLDKDDACPNVAGIASTDPKKNGCPQPDRDKDGVPDDVDACPDQKGMENDDPKKNGCPLGGDRDKDGVSDANDRCPDQPEDKDGFQDDDGCPDPDDDGDGISDTQDACPKEAGEASTDPKLNGCPNPDRDGDTYDNAVDKCPDEAETFNGIQDDDGCADTGGKPLVSVALEGAAHTPRLKIAPVDKLAVDGTTLRAIALEASKHRDWTLLVAVKGAKPEASLARAAEIADQLDKLAHRELAEAVAWDAVKKEPTTTNEAKILVVVGGKSEAAETAKPTEAKEKESAKKGSAPEALPPVPKP